MTAGYNLLIKSKHESNMWKWDADLQRLGKWCQEKYWHNKDSLLSPIDKEIHR